MILSENINVNNVKLIIKLIVPDFLYMEHNITTIDGDDKWGYISKPVYFVEVYSHGKYMFTLESTDFDRITVNIDQPLALLRARGLDHVQHSFNTSDEYGQMMQEHNLSHLLNSEPV